MTAWRRSFDGFRGHLDRVAVGWSREQVLEHAGAPDSRRGGTWVYSFRERPVGYAYVVIAFRTGRVDSIHLNLEPLLSV